MLLFLKSGSIFYFDDPSGNIHGAFNWAIAQASDPLGWSPIFAGGITTIAVLLFVGATGKSAQIPLFVWLPDAMAGPTPVSALIHAATMVTAGVYMVSRASSIFVKAPTAMLIIAVIGAATALFAATIGLAQWDIKRVLAYSTISQLGYMFLACGVGAFAAGIFHVFTHAFFKALLFLGSGSVILGVHHEQDMRRMGGLKKFMPITFATMLIGWLAISGVPLLSGFFSKDEILYRSFVTEVMPEPWPKILWLVGAITALLTAVYMTRLMVLTFWGERRTESNSLDHSHAEDSHHAAAPPRESPPSMFVPLLVLSVGAIFAGYLGVPEGLSGGRIPNYFERLLEPAIAHESQNPHLSPAGAGHATETQTEHSAAAASESHGAELALTVVSSVIALGGIAIGWVWFRRKPLWQPPTLLEHKYFVDEAYDAAFVQPIKLGSRDGLWRIIDVHIIDGAVNGAGTLASVVAGFLRYLQSGLARSYVAFVVLGALLLIGYFVMK
jgi:NADH-quinone oxidoreductase subunit L